MVACTTRIRRSRGVSTVCGACTSGSIAPRWAATRPACGCATATNTRRVRRMAMSPAIMALEMVAMMVAMMLPSIAPAIWRHHRQLRVTRETRAAQRTTLLAVGYASVWSVIELALFAMRAGLAPAGMASPADAPFAPSVVGAVVLCAGLIQRSRWKANRLRRCREWCVTARSGERTSNAALRDGCRLGIDCGLSCAAPIAVLFVAGLMDARMMLIITTAITAERVAPGGARIARLTGAVALVAGLVI